MDGHDRRRGHAPNPTRSIRRNRRPPAEIPFADLKARDLEECVCWLLDALGAKDLEWRLGGARGGAADGGRDLEAVFYTPAPGDDMDRQSWWVEFAP